MNSFLAKCITKLVKNRTKKQMIYDLLTKNTMGGGGESTNPNLTLQDIHDFEYFNEYISTIHHNNLARLDAKLQAQFHSKIAQIKQKVANKQKIKVCFYVMYDSMFSFKPLFEKMLSDPLFEPYIVIVPDTSKGDDNMFYQVDKGHKMLSKDYGDLVHKCYDENTREFIDFSDDMDILATSQPYEMASDKIYSIRYAVSKQILPIFAHYGMETTSWSPNEVVVILILNCCWKIFVNTKYGLQDHKTLTINHGKNAILTGYIKMDSIAQVKIAKRERKKIIIAPHHTLDAKYNSALKLSNFLCYADFFLEIYERYPQIDFVFRPHPLLVIALAKDEYWGQKKLNDYLARLKAFKNVEYQEGGEYFDTFVNSDGIIHDCGSFIAEYLYTDNPCCYMLKDKTTNDDNLAMFGKECIKHYYHAFSESDIIDFIESVVLKGKDTKKEERIKFAKENIRINYPNVSQKIIENLKENLFDKKYKG